MDHWDILEIEPTVEVSAIKKAYAKKLKIYHPEEDPKGFQKLREAYVNALEYAKNVEPYQKNQKCVHYDENLTNHDEKNIEEEQSGDIFLNNVSILYNDFHKRIIQENWLELFSDDMMWDINLKNIISWKLWNFLSEHYHIPREIYKLMNDIFHWDEQGDYLYDDYPQIFLSLFHFQIGEDRVPSYQYLENENVELNYDEYLGYREVAFLALQENDLSKAYQFITSAENLYKEDPYLFCIKGEYYYRKQNDRLGEMEFQKAISLRPDDYMILFYKAQVMYELELYPEAFQLFNNILGKKKDMKEVYQYIQRRVFETNKLWEASQLFVNLLITDNSNSWAESSLDKLLKYYEKQDTYPDYKRISRIYCALGDKNKEKIFKKKTIKTLWGALLILGLWTLAPVLFIISCVFYNGFLLLSSVALFAALILWGKLQDD